MWAIVANGIVSAQICAVPLLCSFRASALALAGPLVLQKCPLYFQPTHPDTTMPINRKEVQIPCVSF